MQYVCNDGHEHFKTYNQQEKMKLHEILSKFHIGHDQIGATVQQLRAKQEIATICQNQPHSIIYAPQLRLHNSDMPKKDMEWKRERSNTTNN